MRSDIIQTYYNYLITFYCCKQQYWPNSIKLVGYRFSGLISEPKIISYCMLIDI